MQQLSLASVLTVVLGSICIAQTPEVPGGDDWVLPGEHLRDNGLRGDVILNAFWAGQAEGSDVVEKVRVPDVSPPKREPTYEYSREFVIPPGWQTRRLFVVGAPANPTLNGQDLGDPVILPYGESGHELKPGLLSDSAQRIAIKASRITPDIWLKSFPRSPVAINETYISTSFRNHTVTIALDGVAPAGQRVVPIARIYADPQGADLIKTIAAQAPVVANAQGTWETALTDAWEDAKLWTPETPHLYYYTVELQDAAGQRVDLVLPRSFGFREVWADGRNVLMNGVPVRFTGETWPRGLVHEPQAMEEQAVAVVRKLKEAGIRAGFRIDSPTMYRVADREGMMLTYSYLAGLDIAVDIEVLTDNEAVDAGGDAEIRTKANLDYERSRQNIINRIKQRREHPSILAWFIRSPWSRFTLHTAMQGNVNNPWDYWPGNNNPQRNRMRYEVAQRTIELIREFDPYRPVSAQNSPGADIEHSTRYLCDNLDLQERAEFFSHYATGHSDRVLWPSETDVTPFPGHNFIRRQPHQMPQGGAWPAIYVENAARLFGDEVYLTDSDDVLKDWHRMWDDKHRRSPVYQRLTAENFRDVFRGWRTAGISHNCHWVLREGMTPSGRLQKVEDRLGIERHVDPRRPGLSKIVGNPDQPPSFPIPGVDTLLAGGEAYLRNVSPLLAYIGGGVSNPYAKDHMFFSGDTVSKNVVLLNDFMTTASVDGQWELIDANGGPVHSGTVRMSVPGGARITHDLPIEFVAPSVQERTQYTLRLNLRSSTPGVLDDSFELTIFPRPDRTARSLPARIWHIEGRGFDELLQAAGVRATAIPDASQWDPAKPPALPQPGDLLLIPRRALQPDRDHRQSGFRTLQAMDFDALVEQGLRVIVFEQDVPNLMGLQTESVRPRRVFISAPGHPVFKGLEPRDMTYWSGSSDLQLPVGAISISENFPDRLWQVSNTNAVATTTLYRPQTGAARALAVSGFDLGETPLLEVVRGKGRILFCQLDVSNRYGHDPAATRIVDNMLEYMASAPQPPGKLNEVTHLKPDGRQVVQRPNVFRAAKPAGADGWGMTNAELFFRESLYTGHWVTRTRPEGIVPVLAGAQGDAPPQVIRRSVSGQYEMTLDESLFSTGWARRKVGFLRAAMIINQGGTSDVGPGLNLHGNPTRLYPHVWIEGFVHPYTAACW